MPHGSGLYSIDGVVCVRVCRRGPTAHVCGRTREGLKAYPGRACLGAALCTRNRVSIQMQLHYRLAREGLFESVGCKSQADLRMRPSEEDKFQG